MKDYELIGQVSVVIRDKDATTVMAKFRKAMKTTGFKDVSYEVNIHRLTKKGTELAPTLTEVEKALLEGAKEEKVVKPRKAKTPTALDVSRRKRKAKAIKGKKPAQHAKSRRKTHPVPKVQKTRRDAPKGKRTGRTAKPIRTRQLPKGRRIK